MLKHDGDTLFSLTNSIDAPLAQRMRPEDLIDLVGQRHFLNEGFNRLLASDQWCGFIFWGPPGTGKTTLARIIAKKTKRPYHAITAVTSQVKEIREILESSKDQVRSGRESHLLFIDEVHRLNKAQQDILLPYLEEGHIKFIGATTENPSFEINNAIASRCLIFHFESLTANDLEIIIKRAITGDFEIEDNVVERLAQVSFGDARKALTLLEHLKLSVPKGNKITLKDFETLSASQSLYYDKKSESHYDTISAFIKSVRGSDPDAAVYYLARMLESGEDPLFIARRLIILAAEDIGNASPMGLVLATNAFTAVHSIGMPEARIVLSQVTTYLCCAEKSNRSYVAINDAISEVKASGSLEIPYAIRNAPTKMMKEWGYGKNYKYAHDDPTGWVKMQFLPDKIKDKRFYNPSMNGIEKNAVEFLKKRGKT